MRKNEPISKVMTENPVTVTPATPLSTARQLLETHGIHHLPVTENGRLVGMISSSDLLRISFGGVGAQDDRSLDAMLDHTYRITDVMNGHPVSIEHDKSVRDAAGVLATSGFHSLPVVNGGKLVGIVTSSDLIRYLLDQY